jgi:hypothetical protein
MTEILASPTEDRGSSGFPVAPNMGQIIGDRFLGLGWDVKLEIQSSGCVCVCVCVCVCALLGFLF